MTTPTIQDALNQLRELVAGGQTRIDALNIKIVANEAEHRDLMAQVQAEKKSLGEAGDFLAPRAPRTRRSATDGESPTTLVLRAYREIIGIRNTSTQGAIVGAVQQLDTGAKEGTIRKAIGRLVEDGVLSKQGNKASQTIHFIQEPAAS